MWRRCRNTCGIPVIDSTEDHLCLLPIRVFCANHCFDRLCVCVRFVQAEFEGSPAAAKVPRSTVEGMYTLSKVLGQIRDIDGDIHAAEVEMDSSKMN